jgi:hypothetical protein
MVKDVASVIAFVSLVIFIPAAVVSAIALRRVFVYLQKSHPAIWQQLGHPSIWRGQWSATSPASKFITQQTYRSTQDPALWRLCERSRIMSNIVVALFVVALLSFLLVSVA